MANKTLMIWFDDKGDMLVEAGTFDSMNKAITSWGATHKYEEAKDWDDHLVFIKIQEYRRKNTRVVLSSAVTGRTYSMFVDDFNKILQAKRFINNEIKGTFRFIKKGSGQAIRLVLPLSPTP